MNQTNSNNDIDTRYSEEEKRERSQAFEAERLHDEPGAHTEVGSWVRLLAYMPAREEGDPDRLTEVEGTVGAIYGSPDDDDSGHIRINPSFKRTWLADEDRSMARWMDPEPECRVGVDFERDPSDYEVRVAEGPYRGAFDYPMGHLIRYEEETPLGGLTFDDEPEA